MNRSVRGKIVIVMNEYTPLLSSAPTAFAYWLLSELEKITRFEVQDLPALELAMQLDLSIFYFITAQINRLKDVQAWSKSLQIYGHSFFSIGNVMNNLVIFCDSD